MENSVMACGLIVWVCIVILHYSKQLQNMEIVYLTDPMLEVKMPKQL